jgi:hypothetical protein
MIKSSAMTDSDVVRDAKTAISDGLELVADSASSKAEDVAAGLKKSSRSTIISLMTVLTLVGGAIWLFKQRKG